jgi:DNA polymerase-3 subunit gamma/tau
MSYLVLARKYRPQTFEEVVGQAHVTRTLANAIETRRVAHAILFSGPRGTGKTTVARILAKAMNCSEGPTATPCNQCQSCREITSGNAADVFEIDGASNNSVDQVRELRENLQYMPVHSRHKIYIIDEVHMLSLAAFNALLKTLEEPPSHVMFMFATTEPQKIPITILSRCQRHDLRRIDTSAIVGHLGHLCEAEKVRIDAPSLTLIAQEAGGSMRDALSLMDHILACTQGVVDVRLIGNLLGVADRSQLFDLSEAVFARDLARVLEIIADVWGHGNEMKRFYSDLVRHFHHLTLVRIGAQAAGTVDLPDHEIERMKTQVAAVDQLYLLQVFDLLFQAESAVKFSSQPRYALEMVFLKLFQTPPAVSIDALIEQLDSLRETNALNTSCAPIVLDVPSTSVGDAPARPVPETLPEEMPPADIRPEISPEPVHTDVQTPHVLSGPIAVENLWPHVVRRVTEQKPSLAASLKKCSLSLTSEGALNLEVGGSDFTLKSITKHQSMLESLCSELIGHDVRLTIVANFKDAETKQKQKKKAARLEQKALSHPMVMEAIRLFDGKVVEVKVPE